MITIEKQVRDFLILNRKILSVKGLASETGLTFRMIEGFIARGTGYGGYKRYGEEIIKKLIPVLGRLGFACVLSPAFFRDAVAKYFKMDPYLLGLETRKDEIVEKRQIAHYLAVEYKKEKEVLNKSKSPAIYIPTYSLNDIAVEVGGKSHATVLHGYKTIKKLLEVDSAYRELITDIKRTYE